MLWKEGKKQYALGWCLGCLHLQALLPGCAELAQPPTCCVRAALETNARPLVLVAPTLAGPHRDWHAELAC